MSLFDLFGKSESSIDEQPDWRQSVEDCLGGEEASCTWVETTASALPFNFIGSHLEMSAGAWVKAAALLSVTEAHVRAVASVEALGSGYLASGRPKILFEAHKFSASTSRRYDSSHPNISSKTWNQKLYGGGGEHQYARLAEAMKLHETAALASSSWGAFQILGSNFEPAGYPSVQAFVYAACQSEDEQLFSFCAFVKANPTMHKALKAKDWAGFASRYNGSGYKANAYDTKLSAAFKKFGGK
ncbi:N-acetylmuramidase family protein [Neorhizobium galegae]|uniref:PF11860 family protein n=1 Tax=Neorhizobium galegae bv. orientalis str. HAMBI 540 TaxID=1028800 RepID=A0A068SLW4_NEOGA|nr:N-acetylmuramidase family protein [Neorhizobium galegae]CDN46819.1 PF11860 family protein [Neorhizobium galegae bv. orientalis str. HAMBI 540]